MTKPVGYGSDGKITTADDGSELSGIPGTGVAGGVVSEVWVDGAAAPGGNGKIIAPYQTIQAAITATTALSGCRINVAFGTYTENLTIGPNRTLIIEGAIRGTVAGANSVVIDGTMAWTVTGDRTSRLKFVHLAATGLVTVVDDAVPAVNAVLVWEGCSVPAITGTGTSFVTTTIRGGSVASLGAATSVAIESVITGNHDIDQGLLLLNFTQVQDTCTLLRSGQIYGHGCGLAQSVQCTSTVAQFGDCSWSGAGPYSITFTGAVGTATLDALTNFSFLDADGTVVNGAKNGSAVFSAVVAIEPVAPTLLPRFMSSSPYLTFVLGSQSDGNYGPGNGGLYAIARQGVGVPALAPYTALSGWDWGNMGVGVDQGRALYFGGGGWGAPDATRLQFYTAPTYTETTDTGVLRFDIGATESTFTTSLLAPTMVAGTNVTTPLLQSGTGVSLTINGLTGLNLQTVGVNRLVMGSGTATWSINHTLGADNTYASGSGTTRWSNVGTKIVSSGDATLLLRSTVADGASAIGTTFNNTVTLANPAAELVEFQNNGTRAAAILATGALVAPSLQSLAGTALTLNGLTTGINLQFNSGTIAQVLTGGVSLAAGKILTADSVKSLAATTLDVDGTGGTLNLRSSGTIRAAITSAGTPALSLLNSTVLVSPSAGTSTAAQHAFPAGTADLVASDDPRLPVLAGQTLWATPVVGEVGYVSANNTLAKARADATGTANVVGVYQGTSGVVQVAGAMLVFFDSGLTLAAGNTVYLSPTTAGRVTNVEPSGTGQFSVPLGFLVTAAGYNSGAGSAQMVVFQRGVIAGPLPL